MSFIVSSIYSIFSLHIPVAREPSHSSVTNSLDSADLDFLDRNTGEEDGESSLLAENEKTMLAECKSSLEEYYKRERFLGLRIDRYHKLIDQRKDILRMHTNSADDVENNLLDFSDIQQTKLDEDELCLQSVTDLRHDIIAQMELLRRRIFDIESKMEDIGTKRKECQDMLIAAADQNNRLPWE